MKFSEEYPNKAPEVVFISSLFHPNVYKDGKICLDILQSKWSPVNTVQAVLVSIQVRPFVLGAVASCQARITF